MEEERVCNDTWVITDASGEIQSISHKARELLWLHHTQPRENLVSVFRHYSRAVGWDIVVALTGRAVTRTVLLKRFDGALVAIRYRVGRLLGREHAELLWELESDEEPDGAPRCA